MTLPSLRIRTSVCANQTEFDVRAYVEGGADAVGVLVQVRHRAEDAVDLATAADLLARVPPYVGRYAVTHATAVDQILDLTQLPIDTIQLHSGVEPAAILDIRANSPHVRLLKAIHVLDDGQTPAIRPWTSLVDQEHRPRIRQRHPQLRIAKGGIDDLEAAIRQITVRIAS